MVSTAGLAAGPGPATGRSPTGSGIVASLSPAGLHTVITPRPESGPGRLWPGQDNYSAPFSNANEPTLGVVPGRRRPGRGHGPGAAAMPSRWATTSATRAPGRGGR